MEMPQFFERDQDEIVFRGTTYLDYFNLYPNDLMQRNGGSLRLEMDTLPPPSADGGRYAVQPRRPTFRQSATCDSGATIIRRCIAGSLLSLSLFAGCVDGSTIQSQPDPRKAATQMASQDDTPYESELWRRFVEIVVEQKKQGRANLVIDHLVGEPDLLDHVQQSDRSVFLCVAMDSEICNGGISQWFGNFTGTYWEETIVQLDQLGAHDAAAVLRKAAMLFPGGLPHKDQDVRESQLSAMTNADYTRFDEYDDEYWPLRKDLYERLHKCLVNERKSGL